MCVYIYQSVQFSHSVVSESLRPHELQHTRPPCPSPSPGVYSPSPRDSVWTVTTPRLSFLSLLEIIIPDSRTTLLCLLPEAHVPEQVWADYIFYDTGSFAYCCELVLCSLDGILPQVCLTTKSLLLLKPSSLWGCPLNTFFPLERVPTLSSFKSWR